MRISSLPGFGAHRLASKSSLKLHRKIAAVCTPNWPKPLGVGLPHQAGFLDTRGTPKVALHLARHLSGGVREASCKLPRSLPEVSPPGGPWEPRRPPSNGLDYAQGRPKRRTQALISASSRLEKSIINFLRLGPARFKATRANRKTKLSAKPPDYKRENQRFRTRYPEHSRGRRELREAEL
jgi:hypothetical protein